MRFIDPTENDGESWQGLLLAAHPSLKDPNFRRSVLFLSTHELELGAFGFVLNRPLGKMAAELLPQHEQADLLRDIPVFLGGPVGHDQLSFARVELDAPDAGHRFQTNLSLHEVAEIKADRPESLRAFVGYAGWSAGQLEGELEQKAWVLVKAEGQAVEPLAHERAWFKIMNALGPVYKLLASVPDDISLN